VLGDPPPAGDLEWLQERITNLRVEVWPGHGHFLHLVDPDRFVELVLQHAQGGEATVT
jgi:pimeloyl-ACP methyl ester carboxylesterase